MRMTTGLVACNDSYGNYTGHHYTVGCILCDNTYFLLYTVGQVVL